MNNNSTSTLALRRKKATENGAGTFFRQVCTVLKGGNRDAFEKLKHDLRTGEFFEDSRVTQTNSRHETLLNVIVDEVTRDECNELDEEVTKLLVGELVRRYPKMLEEHNPHRETPLRMAIQFNEEWLVQCMCRASNNLPEVLRQEDDSGANCLHAAVQSKLPTKIVRMLIGRSTKDILVATESNGGCTPLHLAVEYERCGKEQLELVKKLVECNDEALDVELQVPQKCSVYRYHEHSRETYHRRLQKERDQAQKIQRQNQSSLSKRTSTGRDGRDGGQKPDSSGNAASDKVEESKRQNPRLPSAASADEPTSKKNMATAEQCKLETTSKEADDAEEGRKAGADAIREYLKMSYLRTRDAEQTATWLYGENTAGIELAFDYFEPELDHNKEVKAREFDTVFRHFKFDRVLKSVHFRSVGLRNADDGFTFEDKTSFEPLHGDGEGLTGIKFFFDWLRHSKGVQRILHVTVEETADQAHSDEAMEQCLRGFAVEMLDWRKVDLCPEVVRRVGKDLVSLHLQWSGSNAVLRGWSEPEGLAQCRQLTTISLKPARGGGNGRRTQDNIKTFRKRMQHAMGREVVVRWAGDEDIYYDPDGRTDASVAIASAGGGANSSANGNSNIGHDETVKVRSNTHKWLKCVDAFSDKLMAVKDGSRPGELPKLKLSRGLARDIVVAVVDDGVDIWHKDMQGRIVGGRSFDTGKRKHYRTSSSGHGTAMARAVVRVCPRAKIFIAKVQSSPGETALNVDPSSAAKAIQAAVDFGVDVISMSWMVRKPPDDSALKQELHAAIENATRKGILLFCSSGDFGNAEELQDWYPTCYKDGRSRRIFCIGAATDAAKARTVAPPSTEIHYIMPGENVLDRRPGRSSRAPGSGSNNPAVEKGSSVATAFAAGLAALVIYCIKVAAVYTAIVPVTDQKNLTQHKGGHYINVTEADLRMAREHPRSMQYMDEAFQYIGINEHNSKFINVWNLLDDADMNRDWKIWDNKARLAAVARIGQKFVQCRR